MEKEEKKLEKEMEEKREKEIRAAHAKAASTRKRSLSTAARDAIVRDLARQITE